MKGLKLTITCLLLSVSFASMAQELPIGYWRSYLPYGKVKAIATDGNTLFVATQQAFYTYDRAKDELTAYSKVEGMSDVGMAWIGYDGTTGYSILAYNNGNIDLFKNNSFFNLPDLKIKSVTGSKTINNIFTDNGFAYLSTDIGIVVINLDKKEVKETYSFTKNSVQIPIKGFLATTDSFYAATGSGLYSISRNSVNIQSFANWRVLDSTRNFVSIASYQNNILATTSDSVFSITNGLLSNVYVSKDSAGIRQLNTAPNGIWIVGNNFKKFNGSGKKLDASFAITDSFITTGYASMVTELADGVWTADEVNGLRRRPLDASVDYYGPRPQGPNSSATWDIFVKNGELLVAHGGYDQFYRFEENRDGFSQYKDGKWKIYAAGGYAPFGDSMKDFVKIFETPDGTIYAGSTQSGLFILRPDGSYEIDNNNSKIQDSYTAPGHSRVSGFALDQDNNLWITLFGTEHELALKTSNDQWYKFTVPISRSYQFAAENIIIDDYNQKWWGAPGNNGGGVIIYNDNNTPTDLSDDSYGHMVSGSGAGNLPDNNVYSLAKDKNGAIWIGTGNGIAIVNCPGDAIAGTCDAEQRIVQYDQFAGYLFQNEVVRAIAVDGANRKWIGTNNGVWLISADANQIVSRFTVDNSPLPSNVIQKITIDQSTGDVYIGTDQGMVSYRGTATEGGNENVNVTVFPNPVPSGYTGTIAIKGLVENADVRITDISGQLVYRTKALGGQAVWNGVDYKGHRPQSGIYLVFITNKDGSQTHVGKIAFMH